MESIKGIILGFCTVSLVLGMLYMLRAEKTVTEKSVRFAFAVIFLSVTVMSVAKILGICGELPTLPSSGEYNNTLTDTYAYSAKQVAAAALTDSGINFEEISVHTDKTDTGDIFIKRITVVSDAAAQKIKGCLFSVIETNEVEVINE